MKVEQILGWVILASIILTAYYSRSVYEVTVPGAKPFLTKSKLDQATA
jgi:hypothetical protein